MNRQEIAQELGQPAAQELLTSGPLLRLAYNGLDGLPRVIPIGFHWTGEHIVICTATTSPKVKALAVRPEVAVTIDEGSTSAEAKSVLMRGVAALETIDGIPDEHMTEVGAAGERQQEVDGHGAVGQPAARGDLPAQVLPGRDFVVVEAGAAMSTILNSAARCERSNLIRGVFRS